VNHQTEGERNFHIFYQLLKGATPEMKTFLGISQASPQDDGEKGHRYLPISEYDVPSINDEEEFLTTCRCMKSIGLDDSTSKSVFASVAGILHLGDVEFQLDASSDVVGDVTNDSQTALVKAAGLLGLQTDDLLAAITKQNLFVDKTVIVKQNSHVQAVEKRDSLARTVYSILFDWLVDKINNSITTLMDEDIWGE
jgi:myosin heavy subunit